MYSGAVQYLNNLGAGSFLEEILNIVKIQKINFEFFKKFSFLKRDNNFFKFIFLEINKKGNVIFNPKEKKDTIILS